MHREEVGRRRKTDEKGEGEGEVRGGEKGGAMGPYYLSFETTKQAREGGQGKKKPVSN